MMSRKALVRLRNDKGRRVLAKGEYSLSESENRPACTSGNWRVLVRVRDHLISRQVFYQGEPWFPDETGGYHDGRHLEEAIWPTWPATLQEEMDASASPLADLQAHWDAATSRLRDSAKWMAAVLGAALAAVIPTAPLAGLSKHITRVPAILGVTGLVLVSVTMLLVLRVMRPQSVSYDEIQDARAPSGLRGRLHEFTHKRSWFSQAFESPLYKWQDNINKHPDLYLPCDVNSLSSLRALMVVEEITLIALARTEEGATGDSVSEKLREARAARAARLHELRAAAASVVALGVYYQVRARSTSATYWGIVFGLLGIIAIIAAVAWPTK